MDENFVQEILHELFSCLEAMETQSAAILQLVKEKGLASEEEITRYLEQAGNASNVRWRAARVRIEHLISGALKTAEREAKPGTPEPEEKKKEDLAKAGGVTSRAEQGEKEGPDMQQDAPRQKPEANSPDTSAEKNHNRPAKENQDRSSQTKQ